MIVLDTSAVLAYTNSEPGADVVLPALLDSSMSSVNYSELVQKLAAHGVDHALVLLGLVRVGLRVEPFTVADAELAASLHPQASRLGLSLADRACLALAVRLNLPVMTADRAWAGISVEVEIKIIR